MKIVELPPFRICVVGVGTLGSFFCNLLKSKETLYSLPEDISDFQKQKEYVVFDTVQFAPDRKGFMPVISKSNLIFLVGAYENKEFSYVRDLIVDTLCNEDQLLITIVPAISEPKINRKPKAIEFFLEIDMNDILPITVSLIKDFSQPFLFPMLGGFDFDDMRDNLSNCFGSAFIVENSMRNRIKLFNELLLKNRSYIHKSNTYFLIETFDYRVKVDLDINMQMFEILFRYGGENRDIFLSFNGSQILKTDFRCTLVLVNKKID